MFQETEKNKQSDTISKSEYKIRVYDSLITVENWLKSDDVYVTDEYGKRIENVKLNSNPGSLLKKMIPFIDIDTETGYQESKDSTEIF